MNPFDSFGLHEKELGVKVGYKISVTKLATATKKPGIEGKRARLAETIKSFHQIHWVTISKMKKHPRKKFLGC
jgi:hypothetical protein